MKILAVIPARAGSKGIPNKNIRLINGHPLIYYSIKNA
ncbi:MAG: acylneuraminate cytidylyltransferase family protein, partial [Bacteroidaceae bacterium]|nr:acylneuraminate cytidylyltransferase family protein [Bacteroidaceae bacterium]